jgi:ribulose-phosphate 3-epimerase
MTNEFEIIPSVLAKSTEELRDIIKKIQPYADRAHIDIADGKFVPSTTVKGVQELAQINTNMKLDVHLMVKDPINWLKDWYDTDADRIIIHVESDGDIKSYIDDIHRNDRKVGLALNPDTESKEIEGLLENIDFVQFMSVYPGFYGAKFVDKVVGKIDQFHKMYQAVPIMVDGGIDPEKVPQLVKVGVTMFVSGSYINKSEDVKKAIKELKNCLI